MTGTKAMRESSMMRQVVNKLSFLIAEFMHRGIKSFIAVAALYFVSEQFSGEYLIIETRIAMYSMLFSFGFSNFMLVKYDRGLSLNEELFNLVLIKFIFLILLIIASRWVNKIEFWEVVAGFLISNNILINEKLIFDNDSFRYALIKIINAITILFFVFLCYKTGLSLEYLSFVYSISALIIFLFLYKIFLGKVKFNRSKFDKTIILFLPYNILLWSFMNSYRIFIEYKYGLEELGRLSYAILVSGIISIMAIGIKNSFTRYIFKNDGESLKSNLLTSEFVISFLQVIVLLIYLIQVPNIAHFSSLIYLSLTYALFVNEETRLFKDEKVLVVVGIYAFSILLQLCAYYFSSDVGSYWALFMLSVIPINAFIVYRNRRILSTVNLALLLVCLLR